MDDTTRALLNSWSWRPVIIVPLILMAGLYTIGWWRLRKIRARSGNPVVLASGWRLFSYWLGMVLLVLALISPIDVLSGLLFTMHMIQHLLLGMFAPPLLMLANPMPVIMWGMPMGVRRALGRLLFAKNSLLRPVLKAVTRPIVIWFLFFVFLWGWHDANLYNWTLRSSLVHDFEHITFFVTAMLLWWHITGAGPAFHKRFSYPARIGFTLSCVPINMILGVAIALSTKVIYTFYETVPFRLWNLSVIEDQTLGGAIMWVPGSMMYVIATVILIALWLNREEQKQALSVSD